MTIEARLNRADGALTTLTNGRHAWLADVPRELGSDDLAPDPHDLLDSALAACTALTLELYVRRKNWPVTAIRVAIEHDEARGDDGRVRYALRRRVTVDGALDDGQRARLLEIAEKCPIHRVLTGDVRIESALDAG